jgi:hypothetical protein
MPQRRRIRNIVETCALLAVILIPIRLGSYAYWSANQPAPSSTAEAVVVPPAPSVTPASISLNDPSSLPTAVTAAELVPFSFTIQNTGSANGAVPFKVYVKWSTGEEDVIDENVVNLQGGHTQTIPEQLKFEVATETADVYLQLTQTGQTSHFTLPRTQ